MPKISRIYLNRNLEKATINLLIDCVTLLESKEEANSFLRELLTSVELRMLAKRVAVAKMLSDGYDYQTIRSYLKVTDTTIATVNKVLKYGSTTFTTILNRIREIEKEREHKIEGQLDILKPPPGGVDPRKVFKEFKKLIIKRAK